MVDDNKDGVLNGRMAIDTDFVHAKATLMPKRQNLPTNAVTVELPRLLTKPCWLRPALPTSCDAIDTRIINYLKSLGKAGKNI